MIYLATPYSHETPEVIQARFEQVTELAALMIADGEHVYSPITHCHPIAQTGLAGTDWEAWRDMDLYMLSVCGELWVLDIEGVAESVGVQAEIAEARLMGIPVKRVKPEDV